MAKHAGLSKSYITRQLEDFKTGKRVNEEMTQIVREFPSNKELNSLATFFSKQKMINPNTPESIKKFELVDLKLGEEIFTGSVLNMVFPLALLVMVNKDLAMKQENFLV